VLRGWRSTSHHLARVRVWGLTMSAAAELRVDWFSLINGILRAGYSIQSAAEAISVPRSTLIGWKQGAEPRYTEGERLVAFWCQVTGSDRSRLPMVAVGDWWAYHSKA